MVWVVLIIVRCYRLWWNDGVQKWYFQVLVHIIVVKAPAKISWMAISDLFGVSYRICTRKYWIQAGITIDNWLLLLMAIFTSLILWLDSFFTISVVVLYVEVLRLEISMSSINIAVMFNLELHLATIYASWILFFRAIADFCVQFHVNF